MHRFIKTNWHFNRNSKRPENREKQARLSRAVGDYFNVSIDFLVGGTELGRQPAIIYRSLPRSSGGGFLYCIQEHQSPFFQ